MVSPTGPICFLRPALDVYSRWMSSPAHRQHVVSQVVLRKWALDGTLVPIDMVNGRIGRPRPPRSEGFEFDYVGGDYAAATERMWGEVESEAPSLLVALDVVPAALTSAQTASLVRLVALHLIRSRGFRAMADSSLANAAAPGGRLDRMMELLSDDHAVAQVALARTGLLPAGPAGAAIAREREVQRMAETFGPGGTFFVDQLVTNYERAVAALAGRPVEIARVADGELILGDNPAVPHNGSTGAWGFLNGADIGSGLIVMPLTPRLLVSIGGSTGEILLDAAAVDYLNRIQLLNAVKKVYVRPTSGLEQWVLNTRQAMT